jgi:CDP-diacylglycerol--serine O-phosphatidyltransferase
VPNGFTALSLLLGLGSVVKSAEGDFRLAAWMIPWGVLLDKLDGSAARLLDATSKFGVELDSFADFRLRHCPGSFGRRAGERVLAAREDR